MGRTIQAIETHYKGYRFKSRLEARWAVFLDALGLRWEYEKEGFKLPSGWYLPDFWLSDWRCWLEIKPEQLDQHSIERRLCADLMQVGDYPVLLSSRTPGDEVLELSCNDDKGDSSAGYGEHDCRWAMMSGKPCLEILNAHRDRTWLDGNWNVLAFVAQNQSWIYRLVRPEAAYRAARSARFEGGHRG